MNSIMSNINVFISTFIIKNYKCIILVFYFIFFCLMPIKVAHGTTIIVIKNKDDIFIGADSKIKNRTELDCKIRQVNNFFSGFTNYVEIVHPITEIKIFDAHELATKAGTRKGTIKNKVDYFDKLVEVKLTEVLKIWGSTFSKDEISELLFGKNVFMRVVIIGIENSKPIILERGYSVDFDVTPLRIKTEKFTDDKKAFAISIGTDSAIFPDIERNTRNIILNPVKSINRLIALQASATPEDVGLPIDILHIAPGKVGWIQRKPQCPEIKTEFFKNRGNKQ